MSVQWTSAKNERGFGHLSYAENPNKNNTGEYLLEALVMLNVSSRTSKFKKDFWVVGTWSICQKKKQDMNPICFFNTKHNILLLILSYDRV